MSAPVTRPLLADLLRAYKKTSLLRTALDLRVFDAVADGVDEGAAIAERIGADPRGTRILLDALVAIRLLDLDAGTGRYGLPEGARELLVTGSPAYFGGMARVMASDFEWASLGHLTRAVQQGGTVEADNAETPGFAYWEEFASYASAVVVPTAKVLGDALADWAAGRDGLDLLDVACGHGLYGFNVAKRFPGATVTDLDWDNVLPIAGKHAVEYGVADRVKTIAGDMFEVDYAGPYDLVLVTNVLHHFSPERSTELLRRAADALKPGGRIGVVSLVQHGTPVEDPEPYLFSVLMLSWTSSGEVHSGQAHRDMLTAAGFTGITEHTVPELAFHVYVAEKPEATDG